MQTQMNALSPSNVFSGLLDMHAPNVQAWAQTASQGLESRVIHKPVQGCCTACGQALASEGQGSEAQESEASLRQGVEVLSVRAGWRRRMLLRWDDIQVFSCDTKYINVHGTDGMLHVIESSLDRVCEQAGLAVVRVHRGHAINPKYLASVVSRSDGSSEFVMQSGLSVPGSRRLSKPARLSIFGETPRRQRCG